MSEHKIPAPCPFCGGEAERIDFGPGSGDNEGGSCIACKVCQSSGPVEFGYKENFVSNWNRRYASAVVDLEQFREAVVFARQYAGFGERQLRYDRLLALIDSQKESARD